MLHLSTFGFLTAVTLFRTAHSLNACSGADIVFTGTARIRYRICPNTDLVGRSTSVIQNVPSTNACAKRCDQSMDCFKAVCDSQTRACHFKGLKNLNWVDNDRFNVIQAEQTNIARCPYIETAYRNGGKFYKICKDTDLRGKSAQVIRGAANPNDCAQRCSTISTCVQAVFDSALKVCHIKADLSTDMLIWSTDKQFDVIRQDIAAEPAKNGAWSDLIRLPVIPVAAYVVLEYPSSQRLLVISSWGADSFGGEGGRTQFADYNFNSGTVLAQTMSNTHHDMFCPAISSLQDGRILVQGGADASATSFYDPKTNAFTRGPDMKMARGYQTSVTASDNRIFTIGGAYSGPSKGKDGEIYDAASNAWKALPGAKVAPMLTVDDEGIWREDNHAWLFAWKNSSVFQAGPSKAMNWYGTTGTGSHVAAGVRDPISASMCGVFVMYEPGKILANARAHIITIDKSNAKPKVERISDMAYPRGFSNAVVLPDGTVIVSGGQRRSMVFTDDGGVMFAELFNPATKSWKTLAPEAVPRNYHAVNILLADGRVFSGGGGLCYVGRIGRSSVNCNKLVDHADGQIFSPPYLFNADGSDAKRPTISALSDTSVKVGGRLTVTMQGLAKGFQYTLVRMGSVTHSVNSDQRRIPLTNVTFDNARATITLPNDSGVLIPGAYYLFVLDAHGVPSIARTVQIKLSI